MEGIRTRSSHVNEEEEVIVKTSIKHSPSFPLIKRADFRVFSKKMIYSRRKATNVIN